MADAGEPAAEPALVVQNIEIVTSEARRRAHDPELRARLITEVAMPGVRVADLAHVTRALRSTVGNTPGVVAR